MNKLGMILTLILAMVISSFSGSLYGQYSGGDGTIVDPYQIATVGDLITLGQNAGDYDKHFILTSDIDMVGNSFTKAVIAPDTDATINGFQGVMFSGIFEGNDHKIFNLVIMGTTLDYIGLFGVIDSAGQVNNLQLASGTIKGNSLTGGLCGENNGTISQAYVNVSVTGSRSAGILCGRNNGQISLCSSKGYITGRGDIGGICGENYGPISQSNAVVTMVGGTFIGGICGENLGIVGQCYATGTIRQDSSIDTMCFGGLCGANLNTIEQSFASVTISGQAYLGGLCGINGGTITHGYATGNVSGIIGGIGGLCGVNMNGTISHCYSTGVVSGGNEYMGGFCGLNDNTIVYCYWNIETSGQLLSNGGYGVTSVQMKQAATFENWNDGLWTINEGNDYPHLVWENLPGSPITTPLSPPSYDGSGLENDPYRIVTIEDLYCMQKRPQDWGNHFVLAADIDLSGIALTNSLISYGGKFTGVFDGAGFKIKNAVITAVTSDNIGLFYSIGIGGTVKNLGLVDINFKGKAYFGGLCSTNYGTISQCYVTGTVTGTGNSIGGLCGSNYGVLGQSYTICKVKGYDYIGGLCGVNRGMISQCFACGSVYDTNWARFPYVGGLCGMMSSGSLVSSYWNKDTSGPTYNTAGTGLTTNQMKSIQTFLDGGWDFTGETAKGTADIWHMPYQSTGYPMLWWQKDIPGDIAGGYGVDMADYADLSSEWLNPDGAGLADLTQLVEHWLEGR